jgi:YidC/Oxa1 family membrane protein insertase
LTIVSVTTKNVNNNKNSANSERAKKLQEKKEANDKKIQELRESAAANGKAVKPGSLADKVGMVSRYNEVNDKRK